MAFIIGRDDKGEDDDNVDVTEEDLGYMGDWLWNKLESIGNDEEIQGPKDDHHYNGCRRLKEGIGDGFSTIVQCIFQSNMHGKRFF